MLPNLYAIRHRDAMLATSYAVADRGAWMYTKKRNEDWRFHDGGRDLFALRYLVRARRARRENLIDHEMGKGDITAETMSTFGACGSSRKRLLIVAEAAS